jgi:hypothetical protein
VSNAVVQSRDVTVLYYSIIIFITILNKCLNKCTQTKCILIRSSTNQYDLGVPIVHLLIQNRCSFCCFWGGLYPPPGKKNCLLATLAKIIPPAPTSESEPAPLGTTAGNGWSTASLVKDEVFCVLQAFISAGHFLLTLPVTSASCERSHS